MKKFKITVVGQDKKGIIAKFTNFVFEKNMNIENLKQSVIDGQFVMNLYASKNDNVDKKKIDLIKNELKKLGDKIEMRVELREEKSKDKKNLAIFVTKESHCLEKILEEKKNNNLNNIKNIIILGNKKDLKEICKKNGYKFFHLSNEVKHKNEIQATKILDEYEIDLIVLARFMQILSPEFCFKYENKIINIHPSLLPAFPGASPYRQAIEKGANVIGATAHFVTTDLDRGPIILQDSFYLDPFKNLNYKEILKKGQKIEKEILYKAIKFFIENKIRIRWKKVIFKQ